MNRSKARPFLLASGIADAVCAAGYTVMGVLFTVVGRSVLNGIGEASESTDASQAFGEAIAAPFQALMGILLFILGIACLFMAAVALVGAILTLTKVNRTTEQLQRSTGGVRVAYILNFIAAAFFTAVGIGTLAGGSAEENVAAFFAILFVAVLRAVCGGLKIKALRILKAEQTEE